MSTQCRRGKIGPHGSTLAPAMPRHRSPRPSRVCNSAPVRGNEPWRRQAGAGTWRDGPGTGGSRARPYPCRVGPHAPRAHLPVTAACPAGAVDPTESLRWRRTDPNCSTRRRPARSKFQPPKSPATNRGVEVAFLLPPCLIRVCV